MNIKLISCVSLCCLAFLLASAVRGKPQVSRDSNREERESRKSANRPVDNERWKAIYIQAEIFEKQKNFLQAFCWYEKVIREIDDRIKIATMDLEFLEHSKGFCCMRAGFCAGKLSDKKNQRHYLKLATEIWPENPNTWSNYCQVFSLPDEFAEYKEAGAEHLKMVKKFGLPKNGPPWRWTGPTRNTYEI